MLRKRNAYSWASFEVEIFNENLTKYKSPGIDQTVTQLIGTGHETLCSKIHKRIHYIKNKENYHSSERYYYCFYLGKRGNKTNFSNR
jgi:hypothetical protein